MPRLLASAVCIVSVAHGALHKLHTLAQVGQSPEDVPVKAHNSSGPFAEEELFQSIAAQVGEFESRVLDVHERKMEVLHNKKSDYVKKLEAQSEETRGILKMNVRLVQEVQALKKSNALLRSKAKQFLVDNEALSNSVAATKDNLTSAAEFAEKTIAKLNHIGSPELTVMQELDAKDTQNALEQEHTAALRQISDLATNPTFFASLLAMPAAVEQQDVDPAAEEAITKMTDGLLDLEQKHQVAGSTLQELFDRKMSQGSALRETALSQRQTLEAAKVKEEGLQSELQVAVAKLREMNKYLLKEKEHLGNYIQRTSDHLA